MTTTHQATFSKDIANKKMTVLRTFDASVEHVWRAWTDAELLDQWWAPKPWQAKTKSMDFREGGTWLYCMQGPDGTKSWARVDYEKIVNLESFKAHDAFCDENGVINKDFPSMDWLTQFTGTGSSTTVQVHLSFPTEDDLKKIIEMGFEEGFSAALRNLDELLTAKHA